jgi:glycosyltransferase involved in cell wall biosynthesis
MRIAVIEPLPRGGLLHYATQLADALAQRGDEVELIVARENELARRSGPARRRPVLPREVPTPAHPSRWEALWRRARTALRLLWTWARIASEVRRGGHDAVLLGGSFDMTLNAAAGLLVTRLARAPLLVHVCHNVRPFDRWGGGGLYLSSGLAPRLLNRLYPRFDLVFVHGERSEQEFRRTWPPTRLAIVPHGDERLFAEHPPPPSEEPRVLFFGAWRKMKGLPVLMEAFDALAARRPQARLTIAGPPVPEEGESEEVLAWAAQRPDRVEVRPDYVPIEEVTPLFARARVVVAPYLAGYQSGVVHLAMTMARAVVASDVGDLPSAVIDGETGLVVPPRDPDALAAALQRVLGDSRLAQRLGAAGRERMLEHAGWPKVAAAVHDSLAETMKERSR